MTPAPRTASRRWPLSASILAVLALALAPLGILAMLLAVDEYHEVVARQASGTLTAAQLALIALPLALWPLALVLGWLALRQVTVLPLRRLLRLVEKSEHELGRGDFSSREMATLAESIVALAHDVDRHNATLDAALAEQRRLTREVHHRVKNSLQIVSSLLALHARGLSTPAIIATYAAMQARVSALTMVHRWIYDESGADGVDLRALVADLAGALELSLAGPEHHRVAMDQRGVGRINIGADAAIPVAFLITELASIAVQTSPPGKVMLAITAARDGETVALAVTAPAFAGTESLAADDNAASARIIHGMVRQLRSRLHHDDADGCYSISFIDAGR